MCVCVCVCLDFDEKCSKEDDWDVDMAGYYDYGRYTEGSECNYFGA